MQKIIKIGKVYKNIKKGNNLKKFKIKKIYGNYKTFPELKNILFFLKTQKKY